MQRLAKKLLDLAKQKSIKVVTAESCTGGLVAAEITSVSGSSDIFDRGFVTYSAQAKIEMLEVDAEIVSKFGVISSEVAEAMAEGAIKNSQAQLSIAITGIAGPKGGTKAKPVGLVYIASHYEGSTVCEECRFAGDRQAIRGQAVQHALKLMISMIS
jgi:nicotinamide-nucleotide amidase